MTTHQSADIRELYDLQTPEKIRLRLSINDIIIINEDSHTAIETILKFCNIEFLEQNSPSGKNQFKIIS